MHIQTNRAITLARYIAETGATVRETAKVFNISKSTVHKDVTKVLPLVNQELYSQVECVLQNNKAVRHIRGGEATRRRFLELHSNKP